jgi:hypothetical protein
MALAPGTAAKKLIEACTAGVGFSRFPAESQCWTLLDVLFPFEAAPNFQRRRPRLVLFTPLGTIMMVTRCGKSSATTVLRLPWPGSAAGARSSVSSTAGLQRAQGRPTCPRVLHSVIYQRGAPSGRRVADAPALQVHVQASGAGARRLRARHRDQQQRRRTSFSR